LLVALAGLLGGCAVDSQWEELGLFEHPQGEMRVLHRRESRVLYAYGEKGQPTLAPHQAEPFLWISEEHVGGDWRPLFFGRDSEPHIGCLAADSAGGSLLAGGVEEGVYLSERGGSDWKPLPSPSEGFRAALVAFADPAQLSRLLVVDTSGRIYVSEDQGEAWQEASGAEGLPASLAVGASGCWYQTDRGLYRSQDGGRSWARAADLPGVPGAGAIVLVPGEAETVFVVSKGETSRLHRSDDRGTTWAPVAGSEGVRDLVVDSRDPRRLFLACGRAPTVRLSRDGGQTWEPLADRVNARQLVLTEHELFASEGLSTRLRVLRLEKID